MTARLLPALLASLLAASGPALAKEPPLVDAAGYEAITSAAEVRGDGAAFARALLDIVAAAPGGEPAALALLRLRDVPADAIAAAPDAAGVLERALAAKMPRPRARDTAAELLAMLRARTGDWDGARAATAARGVVRSWLIVGPFGFTRRALHDRPFEVEIAQRAERIDLSGTFDGSAGKVGWRRAELGPLEDGLVPADRLEPAHGCAYALAQLRAPPGTKAVLTLACRGSFKAWWNGEPIADLDRASGYHPERAAAAITFGTGWNRLLVKDTQSEFEVGARIVAADGGGAIAGLEVEAEGRIHPREAEGGGGVERLSLGSIRIDARPLELAARALQLVDAGLGPMALPLLAAAARAEPRSAHLAWLHARALEDADHLPRTRRLNDARGQVAEALRRDPAFVPALERRARFEDDDGRPEAALPALRDLARAHPGYPAIRRSAISIARREGWDAEALEEIRALEESAPRSAVPKLLLADYYWSKGNRPRAIELYREALARDASLRWVEERIAAVAADAGDAASAERTAQALAERHPGRRSPLDLLARVRRQRGEPEEAAAVLVRAAEMAGGEPALFIAAADVLVEAGKAAEARRWLEAALAAEPGRDSVRRLLGRIRGEDPDALVRPYDIDVRSTLATAPGAERYPKAHSICLLDQTVTRVYRDGSRVDHVHQAFKILDDAGVERYHTLDLPGEVLELRTIAGDGSIHEPIMTDSTSEILMPKLEPGAVIEYRYRAVHAQRPDFQFDPGRFYFKDPNFDEPFLRSQYVIIADKGFAFEAIDRNMPVRAVVEERGDLVIHAWDVRESDRVDQEPHMPDKDELLPLVELVERRSWDDLAEVFRERFMGLARLTPELRERAAEVVKGAESESEKAALLYQFVLDHVRGDQGPNEASEIFVERAGSRVTLLKALLDAAQVPSRFAMCGVRPGVGPVEVWDPPRARLLPYTLLVVEPRDGDPVWVLDGGRLYPYGLVMRELQGAPALLLSPAGAELRTVPEAPLDELATDTRLKIRLGDEATARLSGTVTVRAPAFYRTKEQLARTPRAELEGWAEQYLGSAFVGAKLASLDFPGATETGVPFTMTFEADVPRFVAERGERRAVRAGLEPLELTRKMASQPARVHPLIVREESLQRETVSIELGDRYEVEALPRNLVIADRFALYSLTFALEGGTIRIARSYAVQPARLEPHEYPAVLRFCAGVDEAERQWIELREKPRNDRGRDRR